MTAARRSDPSAHTVCLESALGVWACEQPLFLGCGWGVALKCECCPAPPAVYLFLAPASVCDGAEQCAHPGCGVYSVSTCCAEKARILMRLVTYTCALCALCVLLRMCYCTCVKRLRRHIICRVPHWTLVGWQNEWR